MKNHLVDLYFISVISLLVNSLIKTINIEMKGS